MLIFGLKGSQLQKYEKVGSLRVPAIKIESGIAAVSPPPRGYSHVKAYGDVPPKHAKWVTFSPKILRHGSHFGQNNP